METQEKRLRRGYMEYCSKLIHKFLCMAGLHYAFHKIKVSDYIVIYFHADFVLFKCPWCGKPALKHFKKGVSHVN